MSEQFNGLISAAANMPQPGELGTYTSDMFLADFSQFKQSGQEDQVISLVPDPMLQVFVNNANASILPSRYCEIWRYAAGLYVAHFSALYLKTYSDGSLTPARAAATGQQTGLVKEATMGDTTISYDNEAITEASAKWGSWNATQYGQQLVTMARMIGMGGTYVI
ncbi:hypothetical protein LAD12857_29250 [Lacrimispora amygdalina]|uniref:DUF4054 domain-containing protein n=1 Tax=Lacrimispora amygdalina TaxID=253257 RepID=A0ABQ5M8C5_9FIRM